MASSSRPKTRAGSKKTMKKDQITSHPYINKGSFAGSMVEEVIATIDRTKMHPIAYDSLTKLSYSAISAFYKTAVINSTNNTITSEVKGVSMVISPALIAEVTKLNNTGIPLPNVDWKHRNNNAAKLDLWRRYHKVEGKTATEMEAVYNAAAVSGKKVWEKQFKRACLDPVHYVMAGILAAVWQDKAGSDSSLSFDVMQLVDLMNNEEITEYNWAQIYFDRLKICIKTAKGPKGNIYRMGRLVTALVQHLLKTEVRFTDLLEAEEFTYKTFERHLLEDQKQGGPKKKAGGKKKRQLKAPEQPKSKKLKIEKVPSPPPSSSSVSMSESSAAPSSKSQSISDTAQESESHTDTDTATDTAQQSPPHTELDTATQSSTPVRPETANPNAIFRRQQKEIESLKEQIAALKGKTIASTTDPSEALKKKDAEITKLLQEIASLNAIARENTELLEQNANLQGMLALRQQEGSNDEAVKLQKELQTIRTEYAKLQKAHQLANVKISKSGSQGKEILHDILEGQLTEANTRIEKLEAEKLVLEKEVASRKQKTESVAVTQEGYQKKLKDAEERYLKASQLVQRHEQQLTKYKAELETTAQKLAAMTTNYNKLQQTASVSDVAAQQVPVLKQKISDLTKQLKGLEQIHNENVHLKVEKAALQEQVTELDKKFEESSSWGEGWKQQAVDLEERIATLQTAIELKNEEIQRLTNDLGASDEQNAKLREQLAVSAQNAKEAVQRYQALQHQLEAVQSTPTTTPRTSTAVQTSELDFLTARVQFLENEVDSLRTQKDKLNEDIASRDKEMQFIKTEVVTLKEETAKSSVLQDDEIRRIWAAISKQQETAAKTDQQVTSLVGLQTIIHESTKPFSLAAQGGSTGSEGPPPHFGMIKGGESSSGKGKSSSGKHKQQTHMDVD